jgi:hypothetical protein
MTAICLASSQKSHDKDRTCRTIPILSIFYCNLSLYFLARVPSLTVRSYWICSPNLSRPVNLHHQVHLCCFDIDNQQPNKHVNYWWTTYTCMLDIRKRQFVLHPRISFVPYRIQQYHGHTWHTVPLLSLSSVQTIVVAPFALCHSWPTKELVDPKNTSWLKEALSDSLDCCCICRQHSQCHRKNPFWESLDTTAGIGTILLQSIAT